MELFELISNITPASKCAYEACIDRLDHIAKPVGSLGKLETLLAVIAGATGTPNIQLDKKCVLVFCADNGVLAQCVAQSTHKVTTAIAKEQRCYYRNNQKQRICRTQANNRDHPRFFAVIQIIHDSHG